MKPTTSFLAGQDVLFTRQRHEAKKMGLHYDYRIVVGDKAYSWATKKELPSQGKSIVLFEQPVHDAEYALSKKVVIPDGNYGAGVTYLDFVRKARIKEDSTSEKLVIHPTDGGDRFLLRKLDDSKYGKTAWLFRNLGTSPKLGKSAEEVGSDYQEKYSPELTPEQIERMGVLDNRNNKLTNKYLEKMSFTLVELGIAAPVTGALGSHIAKKQRDRELKENGVVENSSYPKTTKVARGAGALVGGVAGGIGSVIGLQSRAGAFIDHLPNRVGYPVALSTIAAGSIAGAYAGNKAVRHFTDTPVKELQRQQGVIPGQEKKASRSDADEYANSEVRKQRLKDAILPTIGGGALGAGLHFASRGAVENYYGSKALGKDPMSSKVNNRVKDLEGFKRMQEKAWFKSTDKPGSLHIRPSALRRLEMIQSAHSSGIASGKTTNKYLRVALPAAGAGLGAYASQGDYEGLRVNSKLEHQALRQLHESKNL